MRTKTLSLLIAVFMLIECLFTPVEVHASSFSNTVSNAITAASVAAKGLKTYTYKGKKYAIIPNATTYTGSAFNQFNKSYKSTFGNVGCSATACACAISIMKKAKKDPRKYWTKNGCILSNYGSVGSTSGEKAVLKKCINLVDSKKPGILQMSSPSTHYVTVVGYRIGVNVNSVSRSDILVMDPATGTIKTLPEAMSYNNNKRKIDAVRWFNSLR